MTALPAVANLNGTPTQGQFKTAIGDLRNFVAELLGGAAQASLTITTGRVTPATAVIVVDTEGAAAADDLDGLATTNLGAGKFVLLRAASAARVVTLRHNTVVSGAVSFSLLNATNVALDSTSKWILFFNDGSAWVEVFRSWASGTPFGTSLIGSTDAVTARGIMGETNNPVALRNDTQTYAGTVGGTGNAITMTLSPAPTAYVDGMPLRFKVGSANTGPVTVNVNGLGTKDLVDAVGNALASGALTAGAIVDCRYNSTLGGVGRFQVQSSAGSFVAKAGDTMTGNLVMSGSAKVRASGSTAAVTGFEISGAVDIGTLFVRAVTVSTSGSGNGVSNVAASISSGTLTITQSKTDFTLYTPPPP